MGEVLDGTTDFPGGPPTGAGKTAILTTFTLILDHAKLNRNVSHCVVDVSRTI
jgi:hypothetical protein